MNQYLFKKKDDYMRYKRNNNSLFNNDYLAKVAYLREDIEKNYIMSGPVRIISKRIKNKKYFQIELPNNNPIKKHFINLNLNTIPRPNYKNGSTEMYKAVNGLCHYCGYNEFNGKIIFSKKGYLLTNIFCENCNNKQPMDFIHIYTNNNQKNRGKEYSDRQVKHKTIKQPIDLKSKIKKSLHKSNYI